LAKGLQKNVRLNEAAVGCDLQGSGGETENLYELVAWKDQRTADAGRGEAAGKNLVLVLGESETHVLCQYEPRPLSGWWCMHAVLLVTVQSTKKLKTNACKKQGQ